MIHDSTCRERNEMKIARNALWIVGTVELIIGMLTSHISPVESHIWAMSGLCYLGSIGASMILRN